MAGVGWEEEPRSREPEEGRGWAPTCPSVKLHDYIPVPTAPHLDFALSPVAPREGVSLPQPRREVPAPWPCPLLPPSVGQADPFLSGKEGQHSQLRSYLIPPEPRQTGPGKERGSHPGPTHHFWISSDCLAGQMAWVLVLLLYEPRLQ